MANRKLDADIGESEDIVIRSPSEARLAVFAEQFQTLFAVSCQAPACPCDGTGVRKSSGAGVAGSMVLCALLLNMAANGQLTLVWTAFNDHYAGPGTSQYTTAWNVFGTASGAPGNEGQLMDSVTGAVLPVRLTISSSGAVNQGSASGAPAPGTPAYEVFAGFIDWGSDDKPHAPLVNPGAAIDYVFTGLDPNKRYSFVGTGVRGGSGGSYALRWSLVELLGAESFKPAHSTGAAAYTNGLPATQVAINTGQNSATGDYAAWEEIDPGADGSFTIRCSQYSGPIPTGTAGGPYCYGLMALRLREFNTSPIPAAILAHPANQTVLEGATASFKVVVSGNPLPTVQWYRDGAPIEGATNQTLSLQTVSMSDDQAAFYAVASNWVAGTSCMATSLVARLTVERDLTPPVVVSVLPAANTTVSSLKTIEVFFSKPVTNVDASDLLINGSEAGKVEMLTPAQYLFSFLQPPPGTVQIEWSADHHITDLTVSANPFGGGSWTYRLDTNRIYAVLINEFMAANRYFLRDEDGDYSDWIELYNSADISVPLDGCYLTDNSRRLTMWRFPTITMPPKSYLLVWASGKNRTNPTSPLHTNFQLDKDGGYLALVMPDGTNVVSDFAPTYPPQHTDVSYGRDRSDPSILGFFTSPTPRAANSTAGSSFAPEVRFSRDSGTFTTPFALILSTTSTNAIIRYTFGTNAPTTSSPLYQQPLLITNTVQVRARAFVAGQLPGEIQSRAYLYLDPATTNVTRFTSPLPIVVFHNYGKGDVPYSDPGQFSLIQVFEPKNGRSALTNAPDLAVTGTIHRRGQATRWLPKMSLRVETTDEYGDNKNVSMAGFPPDDDWVFYAINGYDKVLMHNPLSHELYRQLGRYSSRTRFVEVFIKDDSGAPGPITAADYNGLYVLEEKVKINKHRVNIDELQDENTAPPSVTGGYLFSIDKDGDSPRLEAAGSSMWYIDPKAATISTPQRAPQMKYINDYLNAFYSALTGPSWTNPVTGYAAYIDVPAFIDFHLHQTLVFNVDMLRISTFYCKPRNGKLAPAALWDFDRAFGMYSADGDYRGFNPSRWRSAGMDGGTDPFNSCNTFNNPWYGRLFTDPDFWQRWIDRYQELRQTTYSSSNITALINRYADEVNEATAREYAKWRGSGSSDTTPNQGRISADGWTYTFPTPGTWAAQVEFIKVWFTNRLTFMDTNFLAPPTLSSPAGKVPYGTVVTLTPAAKPGSSVLYTLDGKDPRLPGGAISPTALSSSSPVTLTVTGNVRVTARSYNPAHRNLTGPNNPPISSPWSGPVSASYYPTLPDLRITEIMYHPAKAASGETDPGDFEYLELANIGTNPLSLVGFKLTKGIDFTFTAAGRITSLDPGERVLIVRNLAAFASRYPFATNRVAGEFTGQLDNAGEGLALVGPMGELIHDFVFDNRWYPITDGFGFSLVVTDEQVPPDRWMDQSQWRPSAHDGGSPGAPDPQPTENPTVIVNEVLSNPIAPDDDAIELWNPNPTAVDLGYWYLTDDPDTPRKFMIPPGTRIPGGGFIVFHRAGSFGVPDTLNALNLTNHAFGLSADGESAFLFSGDAQGHLTGYFDGFEFGPAAPGVTFGRHTNSIGQVMTVPLSHNTLGSSNAPPRIGPVIISEIMCAPPDLVIGGLASPNARDEFIELQNISSEAVPLHDPDNPANTWSIDGGVNFTFPPGILMPPHSFLLVVSFSPEAEPDALAAFRTAYGLTNNVPIYGPFSGRLNNTGEGLELNQPGAPNPNTRIAPLILIDRVKYDTAIPWPNGANRTGASLQRTYPNTFGNDPANWMAAWPTPGRSLVPSLMIRVQTPMLLLEWEDSPFNWVLEEAAELATPIEWRASSALPVFNEGWWHALVPRSAATTYFRLKRP